MCRHIAQNTNLILLIPEEIDSQTHSRITTCSLAKMTFNQLLFSIISNPISLPLFSCSRIRNRSLVLDVEIFTFFFECILLPHPHLAVFCSQKSDTTINQRYILKLRFL